MLGSAIGVIGNISWLLFPMLGMLALLIIITMVLQYREDHVRLGYKTQCDDDCSCNLW